MSIWSDMEDRSSGETVRKEDCVHIEIKIKSKEIIYGKVKTNFLFRNLDSHRQRDKWFIIADHGLTQEEISKYCCENGVDIHNLSQEDWTNGACWKKLSNAVVDAMKQAKESYDGRITETHTFKKTDDNCYLINIKLHWGYSAWRCYYLPIDLDIKEYRKEVGYPITIAQYIDGEVETLLDPAYWDDDYKFKWNMTREEWEDDENFSQIKSYVHDQRKRLKFEGYSF